MTNNHPITPPPELVERWYDTIDNSSTSWKQELATQAARWGADQELEACCEWVYNSEYCQPHAVLHLRAARRPQPPSLKEQALKALTKIEDNEATYLDSSVIRRALEQLND